MTSKMDSLVGSIRLTSGLKGDSIDKAHKTLDDMSKLDPKARIGSVASPRDDLDSDGESSKGSVQAADDLLAMTLGLSTCSAAQRTSAPARPAAKKGSGSHVAGIKADKLSTPTKSTAACSNPAQEREEKRQRLEEAKA